MQIHRLSLLYTSSTRARLAVRHHPVKVVIVIGCSISGALESGGSLVTRALLEHLPSQPAPNSSHGEIEYSTIGELCLPVPPVQRLRDP